MARKEITVTIQDRDNELTFHIREMPATRAQRWIAKALSLVTGSRADLPDIREARAQRQMGAFAMRALSGIDFDDAAPLLDELILCCSHVLANGTRVALTPETVDGVISDAATLTKLQIEAVKLHFDFFIRALPSGLGDKIKAEWESFKNMSMSTPLSAS